MPVINKAMRRSVRVAMISILAMQVLFPARIPAEISKGHRILIEKGIQSMGMVSPDDRFSLTAYRGAGFTAVYWIWKSKNSLLGPPPGFSWARWAGGPDQMPPLAGEPDYMPNLVAVQLGDEQNLNDPSIRASTAAWFEAVRHKFPNTILYCNSYGGQLTNLALEDFVRTAKPDMLSFDTYPFTRDGPAGGSPTHFYGDLQRYRKFARMHGVPLGIYTQTYHADSEGRLDPSESELRLNYFSGLAFGSTFFSCFTYNTGSTSLFTAPGGDANPTALYASMAEVNRRIRTLSPALTRLRTRFNHKPHPRNPADVRDTGIMFIRGMHMSEGKAVHNAPPVDIVNDSDFSNFIMNSNDPWLRGWKVENLGPKNRGLKGDVIIAWFELLDESFDGQKHSGEIYVMLVNGLSAPEGSAAECRQRITLNYLASAPAQLQRLDQQTGKIERIENPLNRKSGRRMPIFELDGGTAELFKFKTAAPFVGF